MSKLKNNIALKLKEFNGDTKAVADEFTVSERYVQQIKKELAPVLAPGSRHIEKSPEELLQSVLPANINGVTKLRDSVIDNLQDLLPGIPPKIQVSLLRVLLSYEVDRTKAISPTLNLFDNRTQTVTLVDRLEQVPLSDLRELVGIPESTDVFEGEYSE